MCVHCVKFSYFLSVMLFQLNVLLLCFLQYCNVFLQNELWWDWKLFTLWQVQCITAWLHQLLTEKSKTQKPMYLCQPEISCYSLHLNKNSWMWCAAFSSSTRWLWKNFCIVIESVSSYDSPYFLKNRTCPNLLQSPIYCYRSPHTKTQSYTF